MTDWNPVTIAEAIRVTADRLENGARVVNDAYVHYLEKKRDYTVRLARERQAAAGVASFQDRNDQAVMRCNDLWAEMDTADAAYKYARDLADVLEKKLSGLQTEAKLIMQAYNTGG